MYTSSPKCVIMCHAKQLHISPVAYTAILLLCIIMCIKLYIYTLFKFIVIWNGEALSIGMFLLNCFCIHFNNIIFPISPM